MANMPTAVAPPAQDVVNPSSPKATGMQSSVTATPHPNFELESKVEVKREAQPDCQAEDGGYGYSSCAANSSLSTCMLDTTAGKASLHLLFFTVFCAC